VSFKYSYDVFIDDENSVAVSHKMLRSTQLLCLDVSAVCHSSCSNSDAKLRCRNITHKNTYCLLCRGRNSLVADTYSAESSVRYWPSDCAKKHQDLPLYFMYCYGDWHTYWKPSFASRRKYWYKLTAVYEC